MYISKAYIIKHSVFLKKTTKKYKKYKNKNQEVKK